MIQAALRSVLINDPTVLGLVGSRVYPVHAVQDPTFPFITFQLISAERELTHSGGLPVNNAIFQFSCWGSTALQAHSVARALISKMQALKATVGSDKIHLARIVNEVEYYDLDAITYSVAVDINVTYSE
jgi:hypothetical protein